MLESCEGPIVQPHAEVPRDMIAVRTRQAGKMLVPLLGTLASLSMVVAGVAVWLEIQERDRREAVERELALAQAENEDLERQLTEVEEAKAKLDAEALRLRADLKQVQTDLEEAQATQAKLAGEVESREQEIGRIAKDLDQMRHDRQEFEQQVGDLERERNTLRQQLADLEQAHGDLELAMEELKGRPVVELEKVVVTNTGGDASSGVAAAPRDGEVVVVNREYSFIVMNLGRNHGLSVGQEFQIVRGSEVLGRVKVEKVYDELSAAEILPESRLEKIREGDLVKAL